MTEDEVRRVLSRISCARDWEVKFSGSFPDWALTVSALVRNVEDPIRWIRVLVEDRFDSFSLEFLDERELLQRVEALFVRLAVHEVHEWLRLDGKPLTEPHPPDRKMAAR